MNSLGSYYITINRRSIPADACDYKGRPIVRSVEELRKELIMLINDQLLANRRHVLS
jgi:hypothetical protein